MGIAGIAVQERMMNADSKESATASAESGAYGQCIVGLKLFASGLLVLWATISGGTGEALDRSELVPFDWFSDNPARRLLLVIEEAFQRPVLGIAVAFLLASAVGGTASLLDRFL